MWISVATILWLDTAGSVSSAGVLDRTCPGTSKVAPDSRVCKSHKSPSLSILVSMRATPKKSRSSQNPRNARPRRSPAVPASLRRKRANLSRELTGGSGDSAGPYQADKSIKQVSNAISQYISALHAPSSHQGHAHSLTRTGRADTERVLLAFDVANYGTAVGFWFSPRYSVVNDMFACGYLPGHLVPPPIGCANVKSDSRYAEADFTWVGAHQASEKYRSELIGYEIKVVNVSKTVDINGRLVIGTTTTMSDLVGKDTTFLIENTISQQFTWADDQREFVWVMPAIPQNKDNAQIDVNAAPMVWRDLAENDPLVGTEYLTEVPIGMILTAGQALHIEVTGIFSISGGKLNRRGELTVANPMAGAAIEAHHYAVRHLTPENHGKKMTVGSVVRSLASFARQHLPQIISAASAIGASLL